MKRLTMTVAAIALTAGTAYAQSAETDENKLITDEQPAATDTDTMAPKADDTTAADAGAAPTAEGTDTDVAEGEAPMTEEAPDSEMAQDGAAPMTNDSTGMAATDPATDPAAAPMEDTGPRFAGLEEGDMLSTDITGQNVYALDADASEEAGTMEWGDDVAYDSVSDQWDDVGEVSELVLAADGSLKGIIADVGGFLGLGEKQVFVAASDYKLVPTDNNTYSVVTNFTQEELESMGDNDAANY